MQQHKAFVKSEADKIRTESKDAFLKLLGNFKESKSIDEDAWNRKIKFWGNILLKGLQNFNKITVDVPFIQSLLTYTPTDAKDTIKEQTAQGWPTIIVKQMRTNNILARSTTTRYTCNNRRFFCPIQLYVQHWF